VNPENIVVEVDGQYKRVSFSSIRQPRAQEQTAEAKEAAKEGGKEGGKGKRPLYDVPYFFEARASSASS